MQELVLTLETKSVPVKLQGEDGSEVTYKLKELSGAERDKYLNSMKTKINVKDQTLKDFTGSQSDLISRCLVDDQGKPVPQSTIDAWPARVQGALYEACAEMNNLKDKKGPEADAEEEEIKNG